jgi:UDP-N-acetylmuramoyl-tripeptide--D-alanyl-D-alanine ligase
MKKAAKSLVVAVLGWQVRRLRHKHSFKIIGVAGSIGKTSTKFAIVSILRQKYKVRFQEGNYNDISSVPLVFFGQSMPPLFNPLAWIKVFVNNEKSINKPYPYDFVVVELGTDGPGQLAEFKRYLDLDIGIMTAIVPEHMQNFKDLDAVADEEMTVADLSDQLFINADLCDKRYYHKVTKSHITYGFQKNASYILSKIKRSARGHEFSIIKDDVTILEAHYESFARMQLFSICCAVAIGHHLGLSREQLLAGVKSVKPISGRMRKLEGIKDSLIIDDTYNASPNAVKEALDALYGLSSPQKIAVLGNMNELGRFSAEAHSDVGNYCEPGQIDKLVTIGPDANEYLAAAAEKRGCEVKRCADPYEAGEYLKQVIKPESIILAKGSQNGVFAEESIKQILANPGDKSKLVRQSPKWLRLKDKQFSGGKP